jgi:lysozyme
VPQTATAQTILKKGSEGPDVKRLQELLVAAGQRITVDGDFGPRTEAAVRAFQKDRRLAVDGVVGPKTWAALRPRRAPRPTPAGKRSLSGSGAKFIGRHEGFRSKLYNDPAGHATIGYGHLVHHGPINGSEPAEFKRGLSRERALDLLQEDAATACAEINRSVKVPLEQHQFDALVSFVFNVGTGAFRDSTLLRELNAGKYDEVPTQLNRWVKAGGRTLQGLVNRRKSEGKLFTSGAYS